MVCPPVARHVSCVFFFSLFFSFFLSLLSLRCCLSIIHDIIVQTRQTRRNEPPSNKRRPNMFFFAPGRRRRRVAFRFLIQTPASIGGSISHHQLLLHPPRTRNRPGNGNHPESARGLGHPCLLLQQPSRKKVRAHPFNRFYPHFRHLRSH